MIQMLAAVVVCAAMTRFVFLGLTEEGEQGPGAHTPTASLAELEGTIELEMAKRPKPDFVVVVKNSDARVELPAGFDPKPKVAFAAARDLVFCSRQREEAPPAAARRPAPEPGSPASPHDEFLRFFACGYAEPEADGADTAADQQQGDEELDAEAATNLGHGPRRKTLRDENGATVWPAPVPAEGADSPQKRPPDSEPGELCTICFERVADAALFPCGHVGLCYPCALGIHARGTSCGGGPCPFCRAKITQIVTIDRRYPLYNAEGNVLFRVTGPTLCDIGVKPNLRAAAADECAQSAPAASPPLSEEANDDVDEFLAPSARVVDEDRDAVSNRSSPASSDDPLILPDDGDYGRRSEDQLIVFEPPIVASY